jgi:hypothetical protein
MNYGFEESPGRCPWLCSLKLVERCLQPTKFSPINKCMNWTIIERYNECIAMFMISPYHILSVQMCGFCGSIAHINSAWFAVLFHSLCRINEGKNWYLRIFVTGTCCEWIWEEDAGAFHSELQTWHAEWPQGWLPFLDQEQGSCSWDVSSYSQH